jgi:hypothetical protein
MATITPVVATAAGNTVTYAAASAGGDSIVVGSNYVTFLVRNASGGSINVTMAGAVPCSQGSTHNTVVACAIGDTEILIPPQVVSPSTGNVAVTYSATASITVAAVI